MTRELFQAAINRCIDNSSHDVSHAAMAAVLRQKADDLDAISAGLTNASIVENVGRDEVTQKWRMTTSDGKTHYVGRDVLVLAYDAPSHALGKAYPFVDDASGNAIALRSNLETAATMEGADNPAELEEAADMTKSTPAVPIITEFERDEALPGIIIKTSDGKAHKVPDELLQRLPRWVQGTKRGGPYLLKDDEHGVAIGIAGRDDAGFMAGAKIGEDTKAASEAVKPEGDETKANTNTAEVLAKNDIADPSPAPIEPKNESEFPMVRVAKSTNVESIGHRGDELRVRFIGKGDAPGSLYSYRGISGDLYAEMLQASSPGKFLNAKIKPIDKGTKIEEAAGK